VQERYWQVVSRDGVEHILDREGNAVPLKSYERIIVISPGAVETLYLIGAEGAIAAIAGSRDPVWPEEKTVLLPSIGNAARPNLEEVIARSPDLIIGNAMTGAFITDLISRGYPALLHGADSLEDIFNDTRILGRLTGREAEAEAVIAEQEQRLAGMRDELRTTPLTLKGAILFSANPVMAFGSGTLAGEILDILGVENIANGAGHNHNAAQPILSAEYILAQNPDFLFGAMSIANADDILGADSVIAKTRAGREKNISILPSTLFLRPSPRIVDKLLELQRELRNYAH
jgi:iron complex transport system substrate-binding protein